MTHRDRGIVAALVIVLVVLAIVVAWPGSGPQTGSASPGASSGNGGPAASPGLDGTEVYREGTIGRPSSINPLTARTQADRDLAALVFSGLVALGPDGTYRPDLASDWTVDPKGKTWTFTIRPDATWQDGEPVTSDDVVFTVGHPQEPRLHRPAGRVLAGRDRHRRRRADRHVRAGDPDRRLPPGGDDRVCCRRTS